jgi:hypothetical protein
MVVKILVVDHLSSHQIAGDEPWEVVGGGWWVDLLQRTDSSSWVSLWLFHLFMQGTKSGQYQRM